MRFFELFEKHSEKYKSRKLYLSDMGLGDASMLVVDKILSGNINFSQLDISKNSITNVGIKYLSNCLKHSNKTLVHVSIGCNNIQPEGAQYFFNSL
jgi:Ran GTPase-activating protein (RanGAP) involved in mRNA processing and transport